jgi:nucleotidyltransferase substrate binding protein (TIGR01987 family)
MADIRWQQRLENFTSALSQLASAVQLARQRALSNLEKQGLIQAFEFTHELAWNVIKDYFEFQGNTQITGSRDATREAFRMGLISEGETWMAMIKSRNQTTHTYNQATADSICASILQDYYSLFESFRQKMEELKAQ